MTNLIYDDFEIYRDLVYVVVDEVIFNLLKFVIIYLETLVCKHQSLVLRSIAFFLFRY